MRRTLFYNFFILTLLVTMSLPASAQQVDSKLPWSVRLTESEMIRYPESWQLDFQPKLKWDYCHGLELGAMLDVYDAYGDKKIRDYAIAYADTMVHEDGSITAYKLTDYSLDRINSGKILFRISITCKLQRLISCQRHRRPLCKGRINLRHIFRYRHRYAANCIV